MTSFLCLGNANSFWKLTFLSFFRNILLSSYTPGTPPQRPAPFPCPPVWWLLRFWAYSVFAFSWIPGLSRAAYKWLSCLPLYPRTHFQSCGIKMNAYVITVQTRSMLLCPHLFLSTAGCNIHSVIQGNPNIVPLSVDPNGASRFPLEFWLLSCCFWGLSAVFQLVHIFWDCQILSHMPIH